jgi:hypothetical protein
MTDLARLRELAQRVAEGPYFVALDDAEECGPHANSGLSLVETGRREDWPIARLCETQSANWIAATDPQTILSLLDELEQARKDSARLDYLQSQIGAGKWGCYYVIQRLDSGEVYVRPASNKHGDWWNDPNRPQEVNGPFHTVREAIDRAIAEQ